MRHLVREAGLDQEIEIDSAGTAAYHAGEPPDARATAAARDRGIELSGQARQFRPGDWERFDYVLAMDLSNLDDLRSRAPDPSVLPKLRLLRSFDPEAKRHASVPDPYYGGDEGFDDVIDMCEVACRGLLRHIVKEHGLK